MFALLSGPANHCQPPVTGIKLPISALLLHRQDVRSDAGRALAAVALGSWGGRPAWWHVPD